MRLSRRTRTGVLAAAVLALSASLVGATGQSATAAPKAGDLRAAARQPTQDGATLRSDVKAVRKATGSARQARVIVKLKDASLASYRGGVAGLPATSPTVTGAARLDPSSGRSRSYLRYLDRRLDAFASRITDKSTGARVTSRLDVVVGGVAMTVPTKDLAKVAADPQVARILPDTLNKPQTEVSPQFIGAPTAWNRLGGQESAGEGVIVGVLDTGIWPEHPSLSDPDPSGKAYSAPRPPATGVRQCDFTTGANPGPAFTCNNKLIGAYTFLDTYEAVVGLTADEYTSARDDEGHGTHTATTTAGNANVAASLFGVPRGNVSGIAPRAQVIAYRVCALQGCFGSDSVAAVAQAINDGVDVINFSISGGGNPYADAVSLAFLDAYNAGIFVAASAGNSGPTADTVDHREPWVTSVAASTANRSFIGTTTLTAGAASVTATGVTVARPLTTPAPVVNAASPPFNDTFCESSTPDGAFLGKVVICQRGVNGRVEKGSNVLARGAVGMILYNPVVQDQESDNHFLPAIHLDNLEGKKVVDFAAAHPDATATITSGTATPSQGDVMAAFSSRGGAAQTLGISKPDVTAPGVQILAGNTPTPVDVAAGPAGELFQAIAGTSMSSPHVAGSGALLAALHPTWTPGQIKSALMTTAQTATVKEDGTTPTDAFDDGSGRIDLNTAVDPWFTFDETGANYVAQRAALYNTNYPSLYVPALAGELTVPRTLTSVSDRTRAYRVRVSAPGDLRVSVSSTNFSLRAGASRTLAIIVDGRDVPLGETRFATITLTSGARTFTFPVTIVRRQGPVEVTKTCAPDPVVKGATVSCSVTLTNTATTDATVAMRDTLPKALDLNAGSVVGGTGSRDTVQFNGTLPARQPTSVAVAPGASPAGFLPLADFGATPIPGVGDETISNFNVPDFTLSGVTYNRIGLVSNGYAVLGGGTGADVDFINQVLPDPTPPNNVIAPFWTDLNPGTGGAMRIDVLTDGVSSWIVLEWDAVREFSDANKTHSFQIWIGLAENAQPEDVTMVYGPNTVGANGDAGFATVGAENPEGNRGNNVYVDGVGTLPTAGTELSVTGTPGAASPHTVTFTARAKNAGPYVNYAFVTGNTFQGTATARFAGTIIRR